MRVLKWHIVNGEVYIYINSLLMIDEFLDVMDYGKGLQLSITPDGKNYLIVIKNHGVEIIDTLINDLGIMPN